MARKLVSKKRYKKMSYRDKKNIFKAAKGQKCGRISRRAFSMLSETSKKRFSSCVRRSKKKRSKRRY